MHKFLKTAALICLLAGMFTLLTGCKKDSGQTGGGEKTLKIAMVTDVGGINDQSFNQSAWEGLLRSQKELGAKVTYLESKQDADYGPNMETLYDAGNDLIWGIGFKMADTIIETAKMNPEQKYAIIDVSYGGDTPANVVGVVFRAQEASFLVGYIAGKMSKTGKVGFIGGMDFAVIHQFHYGFKAGVMYANKDAEFFGQYAESFTDAAKGKAIANQMYKNGADVIFVAAGSVGDGTIEAAKEQDKMVIGVDRDQNYLAPDNVITSAMKRVDNAMFNVSKDLANDTFKGGVTMEYGLKEGGVGIAPTTSKNVPQSIIDETMKIKQDIVDGKIVPPYNEELYNKWISNQ